VADPMKTALVTGATGGIGRWIAAGLAQAGYRVTLVGRDAARGEAAQKWIAARAPGSETRLRLVDLSSLAATRALAESVRSEGRPLDRLVNNAGTFLTTRQITAEGHERVLATNHLSPFVLTEALLPALRAAGSARVVNVGSSTADRGVIDPDNLELTRGWGQVRAYRQSKIALLMTSLDLAQRLKGSGVSVNVVHPGLVATGLVRERGVIGLAWRLVGKFALSEEQGAETPLFACLAPELEGKTGLYLKRSKAVAPNPVTRDAALMARVVAATERLIGS
jgi:NAD(P)-dependent dehydrogenase (short-subunit alcohol dehydrogenase family)